MDVFSVPGVFMACCVSVQQFAVFVATYEADQFNCMWSVAGSKGVITFHHFQDGMLCCCGGSMCVQSLNGAQGLQEGWRSEFLACVCVVAFLNMHLFYFVTCLLFLFK